MENFNLHKATYPNRQIEDDLKWIFQSVMGCEHFVLDEKKSLERIYSEMEGEPGYFIEPLNERYVRFHFNKLTDTEAIVLNQLFIASSKVKGQGKEVLKERLLAYRNESNQSFIDDYIASGMNPISHSDYFKSHYRPHYRVLYKHYVVFFDLLCDLYEKDFKVLAIDGRCGSGKSTLGRLLSEIYQCPLISMDEFYLPQAMRTKERLSTPGGNVHYERFEKEVYQNILKGEDFSYGLFSHRVMDVDEYKAVQASSRYVIEGTYAFHPTLRQYSDYKVFLTQNPTSQKKRILKRDGPDVWKMFESRWIPLEELYFNSEDLTKLADYVIDVSEE